MKGSSTKHDFTGIVLRTYPFGESDLILHLLTAERGRISAVAKYARKSMRRFPGGFDLCDSGRFELSLGNGDLYTVIKFSHPHHFHHLRARIERIIMATMICEVADLLLHEDAEESEAAFTLTTTTLDALCHAAVHATVIALGTAYVASLLNISGFLPKSNEQDGSTFEQLCALLDTVQKTVGKRVQTFDSIRELFAQTAA